MAAAGVASRRTCEQMILDGRVTVNGRVVKKLPVLVEPGQDRIVVDGQKLKTAGRTVRPGSPQAIRPAKLVYYLLNKPKGVICTSSDPHGRAKAVDLIDCKERIFCVGRLDADTTGGIILTNDSEFANRLTHPRYELPKTYEGRIRGRIEGEAIEKVKSPKMKVVL